MVCRLAVHRVLQEIQDFYDNGGIQPGLLVGRRMQHNHQYICDRTVQVKQESEPAQHCTSKSSSFLVESEARKGVCLPGSGTA